MQDYFTVTIRYKGREMHFDVTAVVYGYTYRFLVTVDETEIIFERDEEGSFRAIKAPSSLPNTKDPDVGILMEIQQQLELLFA